jgi:hypothetical protein
LQLWAAPPAARCAGTGGTARTEKQGQYTFPKGIALDFLDILSWCCECRGKKYRKRAAAVLTKFWESAKKVLTKFLQ